MLPPLAERMRPRDLSEFVGQSELLGEGHFLRQAILSDQVPSLILWGPPGSGKTTLAHIIAGYSKAHFVTLSAVLSGINDARKVMKQAEKDREDGKKTIMLVDEIHRFNKAQQDAFLPYVESGSITLIGATTENPSFEIIPPLLSRARVIVLKPLTRDEIKIILVQAIKDPERGLGGVHGLSIEDGVLAWLADYAQGDARIALTVLENAVDFVKGAAGMEGDALRIDCDAVQQALQKKALLYDKGGEEHYNVISAFIKSMRGSDPDAALYWLARMLESGEDPLFIARRMIIFAAEDIGNADPHGLLVAVAAKDAFHFVGEAEGWIPLAQAAVYLATAPKSNASYSGYKKAKKMVREKGPLPVPLHLRNAPTRLLKNLRYGTGYRYPHDYPGGFTPQQYLPDPLAGSLFYMPTDRGHEAKIASYLKRIRRMSGLKEPS